MEQAQSRRTQLGDQIRALLPDWSLAGAVNAIQALRGVGLIIAVSIMAEVRDMNRFENPRQLMTFLGASICGAGLLEAERLKAKPRKSYAERLSAWRAGR